MRIDSGNASYGYDDLQTEEPQKTAVAERVQQANRNNDQFIDEEEAKSLGLDKDELMAFDENDDGVVTLDELIKGLGGTPPASGETEGGKGEGGCGGGEGKGKGEGTEGKGKGESKGKKESGEEGEDGGSEKAEDKGDKFSELDTDNSTDLSEKEVKASGDEELVAAFDSLDESGNDRLSEQEFANYQGSGA